MSYSKTNWQNLPSTSTPIIANSLNKMENGIADTNGAIAVNTYSSSSTYAIGDYCMYNNKLYRCKTAIATAEAFNSTKWQQIKIMEEMANTGVTVSSTEPTGNNKNKVWFKKGKNLLPSNFYAYTLGTVYGFFKFSETAENAIMSLTDKDTTVDMTGVYFGYSVNGNSNADGVAWIMENGTKKATTLSNTYPPTSQKMKYFSFYPKNQATFNKIFSRFNIQIERGLTVTPYEEYIAPKIYTKNNNNNYEEFNQDEVFVSSNEPAGSNAKVWFKKGKNLFNAYEYKYYTRNSSETYQVINSNKISVTANNGTWNRVQITILNLKPNTEYTISSEITNKSQNNAAIIATISGVEKTNTSTLANTRLNVPFVTDNTGIVQIALFANWSGTEKNGTIIYDNLQLEQGSTVTSYETYVESQIFTKNNNNVYEEFKQEDVKVSSNEPIGSNAKVWFKKGKNLFDKNSALNGYYYTDGTNSIGDPNWKYIIIKVKSNTTYVASGVSNNNQSIGIAEFDSNGTVITGGFSYKNGYFTTKNTTSFLAVSCRVADLDTYMLEQGTTATSYENYIEPEIYTKNNNSVYENFITKAIVERGNNSNGRYIKYADGTMICYGKATFSVNFAAANSTVQLLNPFTFPAQFAENPTVMVNTFNDADYTFATVYGTIRNSTEISKITLYRPFAGSGAVGLGYIAIGIWR